MILALALGQPTLGCSVVGAGIGASIDKTQDLPPNESPTLSRGEDIAVVVTDEPVVEGVFAGVAEGTLRLVTTDGPRSIPLQRVRVIHVHRGSHWVTGMLVGLTVDVVLVVLAVKGASDMRFGNGSNGSSRW